MNKYVTVALAILMGACHKADDVDPNSGSEIFRLIIDDGYNTVDSGDWLIVHDEAGNLVYSSRFESGDTLIVESTLAPPIEKLTITLFASIARPSRTFEIRSYTDISVGEQWVLTEADRQYIYPEYQGTFTITAFDIPSLNSITASSRFGISGSFEAQPRVPYSYMGQFTLYSGSPYLVWLRDVNDNLGYIFFDTVGGNMSFSYNDIKVPETIFEVDVEGYRGYVLNVSGLESKPSERTEWWGYDVGSVYSSDNQRTTAKIGYIDKLKYYKTEVKLLDDYATLSYKKVGGVPTSILFPEDVEPVFNDKQPGDFSVSLNVPFERRVSRWSYQPHGTFFPTTIWLVNSPYGEQKIGAMPEELLELFPTLGMDKLVYDETVFVFSGSTYDTLIKTVFKGEPAADEYEIYTASFFR